MNILIIEDDILLAGHIVNTIKQNIISNIITVHYSFEQFISSICDINIYDVILIDIFLSKQKRENGLDILEILRNKGINTPLIIMSSYSEYSLLEKSFDMGACDYIIKPFRLRELSIRIHKWYRCYLHAKFYTHSSILKYHELEFNIQKNKFFFSGQPIELTRLDTYTLLLFFTNKDSLLSHAYLEEKIWGTCLGFEDSKNLRIVILRLKHKLRVYHFDDWIQNIHSQGYIFRKPNVIGC